MSALEVLDELLTTYGSWRSPFPDRNRVAEARAAVAELVEAASVIDSTLRLHEGSNQVYRGKVERFRSALARVQGARP